MGYDLIPTRRNMRKLQIPAFTWPEILQKTGAGYLLRYGAIESYPGKYFYCPDNRRGSPISNDGFLVTSRESKMLAKLFKGYLFIAKANAEEWEKMSVTERETLYALLKLSAPPTKYFLEKVEQLAVFCRKSSGFKIT